jgi:lipooligosaccharide transport system permease protein
MMRLFELMPSWRCIAVWQRNAKVWRKLAIPSMLGNIADPLIALLALGFGLGKLVPTLQGMPYVLFLSSGMVCMSTMTAASFEALYSAFSRMHAQKTWESILNTPLTIADVVAGEWLWAATKSALSGTAILGVILLLGYGDVFHALLLIPIIVLIGLTFAAMGLCINAIANGYDFFMYYFTLVITPMGFLSGVFFPIDQLPDGLRLLSDWLPLTAGIHLVRPMLVSSEIPSVIQPIATLIVYAVVSLMLAIWLTRRRLLS